MRVFQTVHKGWTLMEVLAAVAVITIGLVAVIFLTTYNLVIEGQSQMRLQASHLARETVEALRASRDSNWLNGDGAFSSWDSWYNQVTPAYNLIFDNNQFTFEAAAGATPDTCGANCLLRQNPNSAWPVLGITTGGISTPFRRFFVLKPICWDDLSQAATVLAANESCSAYDALAGYQVESTVAWQFREAWNQVQIIEQLYDWK